MSGVRWEEEDAVSLKRFAVQRDKTEPAITDALTAVGADYIRLDVFDLLVLFRGGVFLLECKSTRYKVQTMRAKTRKQLGLIERGWPLHFVTTPDEALKAIGAGL